MALILLLTLFLTTSHVLGTENEKTKSAQDENKSENSNCQCPFKPQICSSEISAAKNCIQIDSTVALGSTDVFWNTLHQVMNDGVKEALAHRCDRCKKPNHHDIEKPRHDPIEEPKPDSIEEPKHNDIEKSKPEQIEGSSNNVPQPS